MKRIMKSLLTFLYIIIFLQDHWCIWFRLWISVINKFTWTKNGIIAKVSHLIVLKIRLIFKWIQLTPYQNDLSSFINPFIILIVGCFVTYRVAIMTWLQLNYTDAKAVVLIMYCFDHLTNRTGPLTKCLC